MFNTAVGNTTTGYFFASRSVAGTPFGTPVPIQGVPSTTFQMALGYVGQTLVLFRSDVVTGDVSMRTLDVSKLAAPVLTGPEQVVARPVGTSMATYYVTAITGPDGEVEGLLTSQWNGSYSGPRTDVVFQPGLDPTRPGSVVVSGTASSTVRGGALAGGHILFLNSGPGGPLQVEDVEVSWLLGDTNVLGGTADLAAGVSGPGAMTMVLLSANVAPPVTLPRPFHVGAFALDPLPVMIHVGNLVHAPGTEFGTMQLPIAYNAALVGARAALQGLSVGAGLTPLAWTNTAWLDL